MEKMGRQKLVDKTIVPQEVGVMPQQLGSLTVAQALQNRLGVYLLGGYRGQTVFIDLDKLVNQPLILAEKAYALDRIDSRNGVSVTVEAGANVGDVVAPGEIVVPAGEVWYINRLSVGCPVPDAVGTCSYNILVSSFPKTAAGGDKPYLPANAPDPGVGPDDYDLPAQGELGEDLRLVGGDKLSLALTITTGPFAVATVYRLNIWGRKGKTLVA
jgi:hypothetical protein